jgi:hypothetical protein
LFKLTDRSVYFSIRQFRVHWYLIAAMLEDKVAQRDGILPVAYNVKDHISSLFNSQLGLGRIKRMRESLPIRPTAIHFCYNDGRFRPFLLIFQQVIGTHGRVRFRAHFGTHTECQYALMSFGILPESLPVDSEGNMNCNDWNQWIEQRKLLESERGLSQLAYELSLIRRKMAYDKAKFLWPASVTDPVFCLGFLRAADFNPHKAARLLLESLPDVYVGSVARGGQSGMMDLMLWLEERKAELQVVDKNAASSLDDTDLITFPSINDVLLGRGIPFQNFPGNQYFITVVEMHKESYYDVGSDPQRKFAISIQILKMIHESGGRFLQRAEMEDAWVEVDDEAARRKASHAFRNLRRQKAYPTAVDESIFNF